MALPRWLINQERVGEMKGVVPLKSGAMLESGAPLCARLCY